MRQIIAKIVVNLILYTNTPVNHQGKKNCKKQLSTLSKHKTVLSLWPKTKGSRLCSAWACSLCMPQAICTIYTNTEVIWCSAAPSVLKCYTLHYTSRTSQCWMLLPFFVHFFWHLSFSGGRHATVFTKPAVTRDLFGIHSSAAAFQKDNEL